MQQIEGISIQNMVANARKLVMESHQTRLTDLLYRQMEKEDKLAVEIVRLEKQIEGKRGELNKLHELLAQIEGGNWAVLKEDGQQKPVVDGNPQA